MPENRQAEILDNSFLKRLRILYFKHQFDKNNLFGEKSKNDLADRYEFDWCFDVAQM